MSRRKMSLLAVSLLAVFVTVWLVPNPVVATPLRNIAQFIDAVVNDPVLTVKNTNNSTSGGYAIYAENASKQTWRPAIMGKNTGASAGIFGASDGWHAVVGYKGGTDPNHAGVWGYNGGAGMGVLGEGAKVGIKGVATSPGILTPDNDAYPTVGVYGIANRDTSKGPSLAGRFYGDVWIAGKVYIETDQRHQYPPVLITRLSNMGNERDTGILARDYYCVATGWATYYDVDEGTTEANMVWTYVKGGTWWARVTFNSEDTHENPDVDILCFRHEIARWEGAPVQLNEP